MVVDAAAVDDVGAPPASSLVLVILAVHFARSSSLERNALACTERKPGLGFFLGAILGSLWAETAMIGNEVKDVEKVERDNDIGSLVENETQEQSKQQ